METYNVVVVGAGSGGLMVAAGAAGLGARVALVERDRMGGDCLNTGCVPSKALLRSAKTAHLIRHGGHAIQSEGVRLTWEAVRDRVQDVIATIAPHDSVERFQSLGVDVFIGQGRLSAPDTVQVATQDGREVHLKGRKIVLATGSRAFVPPIEGLREAGYVTNENVFVMPSQPQRLAVIGGGPIGCELGQCFARLGSTVSLFEMQRALPRDDAEAAALVRSSLEADGIAFHTECQVRRVEKTESGKRLFYVALAQPDVEHHVDIDEILVASGRKANIEDLGLETVGVKLARNGVQVDAHLQTTVPNIYAVGDVAGPFMFTHTASQQGRVVIQNALFPMKTKMDHRVIPWCTFTEPELAQVGLSEEQAKQQQIPYRCIQIPFARVDRMICDGEKEGFLKVLLPAKGDAILGATLVGVHAGDMIHELVLAMHKKLRLRDLAGMIHIYPSMAEITRHAADESRRASLTPTLSRALRAYFRWRRRGA